MELKVKIFITCVITLLILTPMTLLASNDEDELVCFYREFVKVN